MPHHGVTGAVVLDGDDTLWNTQALYDSAKQMFFALIRKCGLDVDEAARTLTRIDVHNVSTLGFHRSRFPRSMVEAYRESTRVMGRHPSADVEQLILEIGEGVFRGQPQVWPDAMSSLRRLRQRHALLLFTAGDEGVQERRVATSGLAHYFENVTIVPRKTQDSWAELIQRNELATRSTWSVGNSVRSDINPALILGLRCILLTRESWEYEAAELMPGKVETVTSLEGAAHVILAADGA